MLKMTRCTLFFLYGFLLLPAAHSNAAVFSPAGPYVPAAARGWEKIIPLSAGYDFKTIAVTPPGSTSSGVIAASPHEVFGNESGARWAPLWRTYAPSCEISRILFFKNIPDTLFILTTEGLYAGSLQTKIFKKIFAGGTKSEQSILSLAVDPDNPDRWFLGTGKGLFESRDAGTSWTACLAFSEKPVSLLYRTGNQLFAGDGQSLFVTDDLKNFRRVFDFPSSSSEDEPDTDEILEELSGEIRDENPPRRITTENLAGGRALWLGTKQGVFESRDGGLSWHSLPQSGLRTPRINSLVHHEPTGRLFAGTDGGVYEYRFREKKWSEIFEGLTEYHVLGLTAEDSSAPTLFAATENGVFRYAVPPDIQLPTETFSLSAETLRLFRELIAREPSFRELQTAVIRYNDVDGGKIRRWQFASRLRSLLPSFSFGKDFSSGTTIDTEKTSTYSPIKYVTGPEDVTSGWDFNVSWNAGDLLWNSAQTSIDSRGKIDAEFRRDLLAEAARIYYERRRLQMEIISSPGTTDEEHFEQLIRLDELTSLLDTLSGGYFSQRLESVYEKTPELTRLWRLAS